MALEARPIWVESLKLLNAPDADHASFEMVCGKGGYVRAVARDLGAALGCGGHVAALRRTWSGPFELADAAPFEALDAMRDDPAAEDRLLPVAAGLHDLEEIPVARDAAARLRSGQPGRAIRTDAEWGDTVWASLSGAPVAIGVYKAGEIHPARVFPAPSG